MFGYIRPMQPEMKVRELEQFKACYCSLCRTLGKKYGIAAKFILNYDFVFLAMLLENHNEKYVCENGKCPLRPFKGKCMCKSSDAIDRSAGYSIILSYWKLRDAVEDESFFEALAARILSWIFRRSYKKAAREYPEFEFSVKTAIKELSELEKSREISMDKMADKFAQMLCIAAEDCEEPERRIKKQMLYHIGRWIYIMDAVNDIEDDGKHGRYNPISARYGIGGEKIGEAVKKELKTTLEHSENMITSAYELLTETCWTGIIKNIIYLGMPLVCESVFEGNFVNTRKRMPR